MESVLKYCSLLGLLLVNLLYLYDFIRISISKRLRIAVRLTFTLQLIFSTTLVVYIFKHYTHSFLSNTSDFLLLISWGIALTFFVLELIYGKRSLGAIVLPIALLLSFVGIYSLSFTDQTPDAYTGHLFLLHVSFCLFGYISAFFLFLISLIYTISLNWLKQKKVNRLTTKMPPLALQQRQINTFLALTVVCLSIGLIFGFIWTYQISSFSGTNLTKIIISSLGALLFFSLLVIRTFYGISFRWNIRIVSLACLLLLISLIIGKHGI